MEVYIEKNSWVQPTEVDNGIVQLICNTFLENMKVFDAKGPENPMEYAYIPYNINNCKYHKYILTPRRNGVNMCFGQNCLDEDDTFTFNGAEMKMAFKVLQIHGYHMFRLPCHGGCIGYFCYYKPEIKGFDKIRSFEEFID